jgi:hypothetical protein
MDIEPSTERKNLKRRPGSIRYASAHHSIETVVYGLQTTPFDSGLGHALAAWKFFFLDSIF